MTSQPQLQMEPELWKASVDEYRSLKEKVAQLKQEMSMLNKRIKFLEPDVKRVIIDMHSQGDGPEDVFPVLLFQENRKVIELKTRTRSTPLNLTTLQSALRQYLDANPSIVMDVSGFIVFLKQCRKNGAKLSQQLQYRAAKLSELSDSNVTKTSEIDTAHYETTTTLASPFAPQELVDDVSTEVRL